MAQSFIDMQDNIKVFLAKIKKRADQIVRQVKFGTMRGVDDFRSWVAKTQLSGRRGPNFGLNRRSGRAFSRWLIVARQIRNIFAVTLTSRAINKGYGYLLAHQKGITIKAKNPTGLLTFKIGERWIRKPMVRIPKRVTIFETFKQKMGFKFIEQNVRRATDGLVRGV